MPNEFPYDVFPSYSSKDKAVVRPLAERLRKDGLKVWFDEWVLKPGDQTSKPGSSRRESAQTSVRPDQRMSGLTSAATREERIADGLEHSKFGIRNSDFGFAQPGMSANAFGSDWAQLEAGTFRFRNPLNQERRFIPLRLDDAHRRCFATCGQPRIHEQSPI